MLSIYIGREYIIEEKLSLLIRNGITLNVDKVDFQARFSSKFTFHFELTT